MRSLPVKIRRRRYPDGPWHWWVYVSTMPCKSGSFHVALIGPAEAYETWYDAWNAAQVYLRGGLLPRGIARIAGRL